MKIDFKQAFQKFHEQSAAAIRETSRLPDFQRSVAFALADMSSRGCTKEQMEGAHIFIEVLTSIGEVPELPVKFPVNRLATDRPEAPKKAE